MRVAIVVAAASNGVIGRGNALAWRLPDDLKRFKALTMGKPMIMGRRTYESIGKALPGRTTIVITRQQAFTAPGCIVVRSLAEALHAAAPADEAMVVGGGEIYREALAYTDVVHLTQVHAEVEGDVTFPPLPESEWRVTATEYHPADERHAHAFTYTTLQRVGR
jgi:dihydrofolate reductase